MNTATSSSLAWRRGPGASPTEFARRAGHASDAGTLPEAPWQRRLMEGDTPSPARAGGRISRRRDRRAVTATTLWLETC